MAPGSVKPGLHQNFPVATVDVTVSLHYRDAKQAIESQSIVQVLTQIRGDAPGLEPLFTVFSGAKHEVRDNVLIVPNWTIRIDRQTGASYVDVKRGDKIEEIEIVTGLRNANESEVISGLSEGDVLVVPQQSGFFGN